MLTAEQIAKRITYDPVFEIGVNVRDMMAAHIAHAIKAEREACAKLVEDCRESNWWNVATAIRKRTQR